ncbi:hypothetical protein LMG16407_03151 [Pandoraea apista]|nr:hypothetical protein LMG16407_03151 [Pandoraea apista]
MWGRTCFALYVAPQQVSRYTTYRISKFIVFRDVLYVTSCVHCLDLSLFPILFIGSMMAVYLLRCPSGLHSCGFRDAGGVPVFRGTPLGARGKASERYCVAAKPHAVLRISAGQAEGLRQKIGRDREAGGGTFERLRSRGSGDIPLDRPCDSLSVLYIDSAELARALPRALHDAIPNQRRPAQAALANRACAAATASGCVMNSRC